MATAESAADWDADAQDTLRDASAAEVSLGMARRQLMRSQRHAATARQATDRAQASPWWRMSAPLRVTVQRLRKRPKPTSSPRSTQPSAARPVAGLPSAPAAGLAITAPGGREWQATLRRRLATVLTAYDRGNGDSPDTSMTSLLSDVTALLDQNGSGELLWLLHIVFLSRFPTPTDMDALTAELDLRGAAQLVDQLVAGGRIEPASWATAAPVRLVTVPVVEATRTARYHIHSGIQRVVRTVVPRWSQENDLVLAVFDRNISVLREPTPFEYAHVMTWSEDLPTRPATPEPEPQAILVPWRTTVVVPEITGEPPRPQCLAALGRWSGNDVVVLLHDLIAYAMPESVNGPMMARFSNLISVVRTAKRVATVSESVAQDFTGFAGSFVNQGVPAPPTRAQLLPIDACPVSVQVQAESEQRLLGVPGLPMVLSVSSLEPRKNQTAILIAAERLWSEGLGFQVVFIAANRWMSDTFDAALIDLQQRGRPVRVITQASEDLLWSAYRVARFTVFVSAAEGFGLPAAESIAVGTPVVLSNHGSMAEIGRDGGAALVNPYDIGAVTDAMRRLLTDDEYLASLEQQCRSRAVGSWDEYARSTWDWLVHGRE
ncbi:MAG: glycosyltransferase [Actinomycetes bacterium]